MSLVSLRKKDLSEETLDALGVDITYLHKSKFDPATLPALLEDHRPQEDRHPASARLRRDDVRPAWRRRCGAFPRSCTSTRTSPTRRGFRRSPIALLERYTDIAIAVSQSTADFVVKARLVPPEKVKVVYLGVPLEEFSRHAIADEICGGAAASSASRRAISPSAP